MSRRRRSPRPTRVLLALVAATLGAALALVPLATTASAAGPGLTYTLENGTTGPLWLKAARFGPGQKCEVNATTGAVDCPETTPKDFPGDAPFVIRDGKTGTITLDVDPSKRPEHFQVIYVIPLGGTVVISEHGAEVGCRVYGGKEYVCKPTDAAGPARSFVVLPA
jgi:hypothetical protein